MIHTIKDFPGDSDGKESTCNAGDLGLIPRSGRSPGEGNSYPLQYSCFKNSIDRVAWQATYNPWDHKESDTTKPLTLTNGTFKQFRIFRDDREEWNGREA